MDTGTYLEQLVCCWYSSSKAATLDIRLNSWIFGKYTNPGKFKGHRCPGFRHHRELLDPAALVGGGAYCGAVLACSSAGLQATVGLYSSESYALLYSEIQCITQ